MKELRIPVVKIPDEGLPVSVEFTGEDIRPEDALPLPVKTAQIEGELTLMGEEALFRGSIHAILEQPCDRCLEPLEQEVEVDCTWFFEPDTGEDAMLEEPEVRHLDRDTVDLGRYAWEELALAVPPRCVCSDSEPCARRDEFVAQAGGVIDDAPEGDTPFANLKELFPDLRGEDPKE